MQSKTSCFNGTLFRKNLTRFWPLWGLASFVGALFPLAMLLNLARGDWSLTTPETVIFPPASCADSPVPVPMPNVRHARSDIRHIDSLFRICSIEKDS